MRNKMITLDPTSYEIAKDIKNFSGWVRKHLKNHAEGEDLVAAIRARKYWKEMAEKWEAESIKLTQIIYALQHPNKEEEE